MQIADSSGDFHVKLPTCPAICIDLDPIDLPGNSHGDAKARRGEGKPQRTQRTQRGKGGREDVDSGPRI